MAIDFSQPPVVFEVGDRVHLIDTPHGKTTRGTIIEVGDPNAAPSVLIDWDAGGKPEWWNNIALEPTGEQIIKVDAAFDYREIPAYAVLEIDRNDGNGWQDYATVKTSDDQFQALKLIVESASACYRACHQEDAKITLYVK